MTFNLFNELSGIIVIVAIVFIVVVYGCSLYFKNSLDKEERKEASEFLVDDKILADLKTSTDLKGMEAKLEKILKHLEQAPKAPETPEKETPVTIKGAINLEKSKERYKEALASEATIKVAEEKTQENTEETKKNLDLLDVLEKEIQDLKKELDDKLHGAP
ncbi:hypothetical protein J6590_105291 [Homalodisca vitripennis]|nr:hypothetical protein J6590_105291 [Homalodisca vitripennis]